jgi:hypothetical protein
VPPEIKRWNWGAFLLNWIWGIGNETYVALLVLVPLLNIVWIFVLGAKGSEWAWRNKRWNDVAHFKRVQRNWAIAGVAVLGGGIALGALMFTLIFVLFGHSEAYRTAVAELTANPAAISELGTPITTGFPMGNISTYNDTGSAQLVFSATGPKATGTVVVTETLRAGHWVVIRMQLDIKGQNRRINLVPSRGASRAPARQGRPRIPA